MNSDKKIENQWSLEERALLTATDDAFVVSKPGDEVAVPCYGHPIARPSTGSQPPAGEAAS